MDIQSGGQDRWSDRWRAWTDAERLQRHENTLLLVVTLLIGAGVGLLVVAFIVATERLAAILLPAGGPTWQRVVVPTAGALVSGALLARYFPNARGSGIPQTKTALFLHDGYIRLKTVVGKFGCSALTLASGIALGREGPTVQVGAGIASVFGRRLGLGPDRVRALIPAATSAALAAAFNTPIAAVLFTLEEILGDLHAPVLGSIVISSVTSWAVLHLLLGDEPLFHVPAYQLVQPLELIAYAALGIAGGFVSTAFVKLLLWMRGRFLSLPKSTVWWQPAVGGLLVGVLGLFVPFVLGVGYDHVGEALNGRMAVSMMALLLVLRLVATAIAYASGNAGGIFGPSLFIGAMLGGTVGGIVHGWFPDVTGSAGAYALVGMGTAFAGIVRTPMTSVIMIFEITRDYTIIVPVMVANLISYFISERLQPHPVYEALLTQDGIQLPRPRAVERAVTVAHVVRQVYERAAAGEHVGERLAALRDLPRETREPGPWPVVEADRLVGMLTLKELEEASTTGRDSATLAELVDPPQGPVTAESFVHVHPDQSLDTALRRMGQSGLDVLPVVSRKNVRELVGVVALADIPQAYGGEGTDILAAQSAAGRGISPKAMLTTVVAGVLGLFLLGGFLTHHYYAERLHTAAQFFRTGNDFARQGRNAEAIEQFRSALSLTHGDRYRLALGLALARAGRETEAKVYLDEVLRTEPANGPANLALARLARARNDLKTATARYWKALGGDWSAADGATRIDGAFELVGLLDAAGNSRQAIAELLRLAGQTKEPAVLIRVAHGLLSDGSTRQAADLFREVLRDNPTSAPAYAGLGDAERANKDFQAAQQAYAQAASLNPEDVSSRDKAALLARVLALDPRARGIRIPERYDRSRLILAGALEVFDACSPPVPSAALTATIAQARRAVGPTYRPRSVAEGADENIRMALDLWAGRRAGCQVPQNDEAVALVLGTLAK
jgi:chloride channel protein, CIC family